MADLTINKQHTGVLIMDYQAGIVQGYTQDANPLPKVAQVLDGARKAGIPVIYVVVRFREGYPEVSPRNRGFSRLSQSGMLKAGTPETEPPPAIAPKPGDVVVVKHRIGAFQGTDLPTILRARDITTLVMFGIATSGVVLSTVRYAADADYDIILLRDLCFDRDPEVHRVLIEKVFAGQTTLATSDDFLRAVG